MDFSSPFLLNLLTEVHPVPLDPWTPRDGIYEVESLSKKKNGRPPSHAIQCNCLSTVSTPRLRAGTEHKIPHNCVMLLRPAPALKHHCGGRSSARKRDNAQEK